MDIFLARQPIFDSNEEVCAYELLFRSGLENLFSHANPTEATAQVIVECSEVLNLDEIAPGKRVFVNATRESLVDEHITLLPKDRVTVEILETVEPDAEVIAACERLKAAGYELVLDDFVYDERYRPLMHLADMIKVDFLETEVERQQFLAEQFVPIGIPLLAEKIETREAFQRACDMGYTYYQGYFFCRPQVLRAKTISGFRLNYLGLLKEIYRPALDFHEIAQIMQREMALCYKLLRYLNSAWFGLKNKISSVGHAVTYLGEREFRKWAAVVVVANLAADEPQELVVHSLVRARFCESLAPLFGMAAKRQELFLMGMFSLIDVILGRPMIEVLTDLPLANEIRAALLGELNRHREVFDYVLACERADWATAHRRAAERNVDESKVPPLYRSAVAWAHQTFDSVATAKEA